MDVKHAEQPETQAYGGQDQAAADPTRSQAWGSAVEERTLVTEAVYRFKNLQRFNQNRPRIEGDNADGNSQKRASMRTTKYPVAGSARPDDIQDESEDETLLRLSNEFSPVVEPEWDTVVYIGPPPQEHGQDDYEYEYIKQHFSKPYLMNSQTLRDTGSARFANFFGPMSVRAERRLKKLGIHRLLPQDRKPRYYIDLRPMQDEDEALLMITELTCTPGVLSWHISHLASGVPRTLVGGKDDLNITSKPYARSWVEVDDSAQNEFDDGNLDGNVVDASDATTGILDLEPEYSALRHHMAIERLLHALVGQDPKLNSAPKVWTYFSIARFFDCATNNRVSTRIYDWLFSSNNTNFVQANPETGYRMALGMKSPDMLRATFAMLVGERALMQADRTTTHSIMMKPSTNQVSIHGRLVSHLDDDEVNRIDHAAHSLTRRMTHFFYSFVDSLLTRTVGRTELAKLKHIQQYLRDTSVADETLDMLRDYIQGEFFQALSQNVEAGDLMRLYRTMGLREFGWLRRSQSFTDSYNAMPLPQRLLTQTFWSQLEKYGLYQEHEKMLAWSQGHSLEGLSELAPDFNGVISCVHKSALVHSIERVNDQMLRDKAWFRKIYKAWSTVRPDSSEGRNLTNFDGFVDDVPCSDQEVARAMRGLGMNQEIRGSDFHTKPYEAGTFDQNDPDTSVANQNRRKGSDLRIHPAVLLAELSMEMRKKIMREVLTPGYVSAEMGIESEISISQMDILLCLNDEEWKYLPLWADGLDDGTGGVFAELDVPDMEGLEGFRGGKMGLSGVPSDVGSVGGSFSMASDSEDFDEVMTDEGVSTVGKASRIATDGTTSAGASTVMSFDEEAMI